MPAVSQVYIVSAPVHTGKSSSILEWTGQTPGVAGIVAPEVQGLKVYVDVKTGRRFPHETRDLHLSANALEIIGPYRFLRESFREAQRLLLSAMAEQPIWLVLDEIGKLELWNKGLEPAAGQIIRAYKDGIVPGNLVLIIRDSLLDAARERYGIDHYCEFELPLNPDGISGP